MDSQHKKITRVSMVPGDYGYKALRRLGGPGPHVRITLNGKPFEMFCITADSKAGYVDVMTDYIRKAFASDIYRLHGKVEITTAGASPE